MPIPTELLATNTGHLDPDRGPVAAQAVRVWQAQFRRFDPVLGPLSTGLLLARAVEAHAAAFPWLPPPSSAQNAFDRFAHSIDGRSPADIVAVIRALLATFAAEIADLIGERLATRFLWAVFPLDGVQEE